ncbi:MAG: DUF3379 family protein [Steroidobacter sp.]
MNCLEFRRAVGAQPDIGSAEVRRHMAECEACARYSLELQEMDRLIHRALTIDLSTDASPPAQQRSLSRKRTGYWAAAASLLATLGLGAFLWLASPSASFAEQLIEHVQHEAGALVRTPHRVDASEVAAVLKDSGVRLKPGALNVSYVMSCWFRGHHVPHMVVQSAHGPVTVLVLRHESAATQPQRFEEEGFTGAIVPAPHGVLAVLGRDVPIEGVAEDLLQAIEYED